MCTQKHRCKQSKCAIDIRAVPLYLVSLSLKILSTLHIEEFALFNVVIKQVVRANQVVCHGSMSLTVNVACINEEVA
jgi:hypothetical protein